MTISQPPRFASRLLKRLVPGQDHDALLGDLCEECQRGRSIVWYCLQILAAVIVGTLKDIRAHALVAARAIVAGLISQQLLVTAIFQFQNVLTGAGFMWGDRWIGLPRYWHWPSYTSWSFAATFHGLQVAGVAMIGWIIVRPHRGHGVTLVLAYCGVLWAIRFASFAQIALLTHQQPAYLRSLWWQIQESLLMIFGGYIATRRPKVA
jgi:hypothetical protein